MKILLLASHAVSGHYMASLMERGYSSIVAHGGGAPLFESPDEFRSVRKEYMECDGCLLVSDDPEMRKIADYFVDTGKPVWRYLADVPRRV